MSEPLADRFEELPVVASSTVFEGRVWDVVSETVDLGEAGEVTREFVRHPGAVAVAAPTAPSLSPSSARPSTLPILLPGGAPAATSPRTGRARVRSGRS